ncbi:hypothetical protein [Peterkaempfera griseoplana]|uniref:hypothetical protein n=1 Tax=Peterkaempfera griseoplana TaxID=66896 RepID=UPI0006E2F55E|nr:hypothetical protein [Peterkaempfera griseoplana]
MAETPVKKVLTITLEIEVGEVRTRGKKVGAAYEEIVRGALEAARRALPPGSINRATSRAKWEFRHWNPDERVFPKGQYKSVKDTDPVPLGDE